MLPLRGYKISVCEAFSIQCRAGRQKAAVYYDYAMSALLIHARLGTNDLACCADPSEGGFNRPLPASAVDIVFVYFPEIGNEERVMSL